MVWFLGLIDIFSLLSIFITGLFSLVEILLERKALYPFSCQISSTKITRSRKDYLTELVWSYIYIISIYLRVTHHVLQPFAFKLRNTPIFT